MVNRSVSFLALGGRQLSRYSLSLRRDTRRRRGLNWHKMSAWIIRPPVFTPRRRDIVSAEQPAAGAETTRGQGFVACLFPQHAGMTDILSALCIGHCAVRQVYDSAGGLCITSARNGNGEHSTRPPLTIYGETPSRDSAAFCRPPPTRSGPRSPHLQRRADDFIQV